MGKSKNKQKNDNSQLSVAIVSTDRLVPYARNARTHSAKQIDQIAASVNKFGFNNPVLIDQNFGIIAGHGRVLAAQKLGMTEIPTITLSHLDENQKRAFVLADNKIALNSGWDANILEEELKKISEDMIANTGFSDREIQAMLSELTETADELNQKINKVKTEFQKRAEKENDEKTDALDSEFWVCICFKNRKQKDEFLNEFKLAELGDKYLDGNSVGEILRKEGNTNG